MEELGRQAHSILQVEDEPAIARERVQPVGAQPVRAVRLHLDLAVQAISHREERPSHHGLPRRCGGPPHSEELPFDEGVFERAAPGTRLRGERPDQETPRDVDSPGQAKRRAGRGLRAHHRGRVAELEGESPAEVEVLVPEKVAHVVLDRELGACELDAGEEKSEAPFLRKREVVRPALDRPETGLLAPITRVQAHHWAFPFQGEAASRRHLEEPCVHSEPRDLASSRVEPGLPAPLVVEERASCGGVERAESAGEGEVPPVAVAVGVVEQVEPEPPTQELLIRVEDLAGRTVRPLRHGERHLLAQAEEVFLLDRDAVVTLPTGSAERARQLRGPRVVRVHDDVDFALDAFDGLRGDRHGPEHAELTQVPLGLGHPRRFEDVSLSEEEFPPDDLRPRHTVNRVGNSRQEGSLGILKDVLGLDPDAADAGAGLARRGRGHLGREENAQQDGRAPEAGAGSWPAGTRIPG